ncbi:MAG: phospholipase A [Gammaproteobacteria bacterium]|nr:phospholipase A [Gammaproteobacteria bacterium]MCP4088326.1 phospholipase A [Gammaproteobacteria bacterium]MCP4276363.1 phospholipase A [Gammaproteobacteria bacterium]MCP4831010.1 phospholipase A [Gammaproteobacteria bacterium]MCP4927469.1 phospholipase A [Gammaproteobacteria bacterium]
MASLSKNHASLIATLPLFLICTTALAEPDNTLVESVGMQTQLSPMEKCLLESIKTAAPDTAVSKLQSECKKDITKITHGMPQDTKNELMTPIQEQMLADQITYERSFAISPFQPNYFIASHNSDPNEAPFEASTGNDVSLDKEEAEFQISIKAPLWRNMFGSNNDLMAAYTQKSWLQKNNDDISNTFRETNYQPEIFLRHYGGPEIFGGQTRVMDIGFNHESNGHTGDLSRSWDRVIGRMLLDYDSVAVDLRAWYRIPENDADDENPHMHRYYGYGDVRVSYAPNKNTFSAMLRPGTEENGLELTWSYPLNKSFRLYAQYWNGYGESLIDYDVRVKRIGIGIALNDWLQRN